MLKFLNRPGLAIAAGLVVIFLIIIVRSYIKLVDHLSELSTVVDESDGNLFSSKDVESNPNYQTFGPQIPRPLKKPIDDEESTTKEQITLGTFEALNGTCFLRKGHVFTFQEPDDFTDLQNAIEEAKHGHESDNDDIAKQDMLTDVLDLSFNPDEVNSYFKFCAEISRYRMYSPQSSAADDLLYDMKTQPIYKIHEITEGSQFKARAEFDNDVVALLRPKRTSREQQAMPNQIYFAEFERHTSEIAAYHLDRVLGFYRAFPTVGRNVNMIVEMMRISEPKLQRTFFISPKPDENMCFIGNCQDYCDSYHPICGSGTIIEASFTAFFPEAEGAEREIRSHPWTKSYDEQEAADWETDPGYCEDVKKRPEFRQGRLLLELIDLSISDFLTGNVDRYNYQRFKAFAQDAFVLNVDNGRAFGRAFHDELRILAPMLQCCMIRSSTLETLLDIHNSNRLLSERMKKSMASDPIEPVLWEPHLQALDRRLVIVLQAVRDCITRNQVDDVIISSDTVDFT